MENEKRVAVSWYEWYYEVSNKWNFRSVERQVVIVWKKGKIQVRTRKGLVKKKLAWWWVYEYVQVSKRNRQTIHWLHRVVLCSFSWFDLYHKKHVNHIDWNPTNNNLENLEFVSPKENSIHWHKVMVPIRRKERMENFKLPIQVLQS